MLQEVKISFVLLQNICIMWLFTSKVQQEKVYGTTNDEKNYEKKVIQRYVSCIFFFVFCEVKEM